MCAAECCLPTFCQHGGGALQIHRQAEDVLATGVLDKSVSAPRSSGVAKRQFGFWSSQSIQNIFVKWPVGRRGDSWFESRAGHFWHWFHDKLKFNRMTLQALVLKTSIMRTTHEQRKQMTGKQKDHKLHALHESSLCSSRIFAPEPILITKCKCTHGESNPGHKHGRLV